MKVIVISKTTFTVTEYSDVSNIAYDSSTGTYTITHGGGTATANSSTHKVSILW